MKKILSATCAMMLASAGMMANAQQLPNVGFDVEGWKEKCGKTYSFPALGNVEDRERPGIEPNGWNGSSVNQNALIDVVEQELIVREYKDDMNKDSYVSMFNTEVGAFGITSQAPGYITLGTPWVAADMSKDNCDGGTYGGVSFTSKPDAIVGDFYRIDDNNVADKNEASHVIVYLWNGTYTSKIGKANKPSKDKDNVDRAILRNGDASSKGVLIASCDYTFNSTKNAAGEKGWQTLEIPLEYVSDENPEMMNVIISAGEYWDRNALLEGTKLNVDNVHFVYYSRLKSLKLNGVEIEGFSPDVYEYTVEGDFITNGVNLEDYELMSSFTSANTDIQVDQNGNPEYAEITVGRYDEDGGLLGGEYKDVDGQTSHTYRINFKQVYHNSRLASLKVNDVDVNGFSSDVYSYYVAGEVPAIEAVGAVAVDPEATVEMTRDEEAATITIVVTNPKGIDEDGESSHTYVLNFQKFYTPAGQKYNGTLTIQLGDGNPFSMEDQSVYIDVKEDGTCTFGLYQFAMGPGMVLGDIVVENVAIASDETGTTYNGEKKDIVLFLNGSAIFADATVSGMEDADGNLTMTIPVIWKTGIGDAAPMMTINVTFNGKKDTGAGVESVAGDGVKVYAAAGCVVVEGAEGAAQVYTADGKQVAAEVVNGKAEIALANGLYIVRVGNKVQKVVVK